MTNKIKINTKIIFILLILTILILFLIYLISNFYEKFDLACETKDWIDKGCWNDRGANPDNSPNPSLRAIKMPGPNFWIGNKTKEECFRLANLAGADIIGLQYPVPDPSRAACFYTKFNNDNKPSDYMKYGEASTCPDLGGAYINHVWINKSIPVVYTLNDKKKAWDDQGCWMDKGVEINTPTDIAKNKELRALFTDKQYANEFGYIRNQTEEECFDKAIQAGADIIGFQYPQTLCGVEKTQCFFSKFNNTNYNNYMKYGTSTTVPCNNLGGNLINRIWKKNPFYWIDPNTPNEQVEMGGSFINNNDPNKRITVQAVKKLETLNGPTIYLVKDGNNIKMVTNDNRQSRYYTKSGSTNTTIADLEADLPSSNKSIIPLSKWNLYNNNNGGYLVFLKSTPVNPNTPIDKLEMGGASIHFNRFSKRIQVQAVKTLENTNGLKIYLIKDGNYIKMVTNDNKESRYYTKPGSTNTTIADLEFDLPSNKSIIPLSKWNTYYKNNGDYLVFIKQQAPPTPAPARPAAPAPAPPLAPRPAPLKVPAVPAVPLAPPKPALKVPAVPLAPPKSALKVPAVPLAPPKPPKPVPKETIITTLILNPNENNYTGYANNNEPLPSNCDNNGICTSSLTYSSQRI